MGRIRVKGHPPTTSPAVDNHPAPDPASRATGVVAPVYRRSGPAAPPRALVAGALALVAVAAFAAGMTAPDGVARAPTHADVLLLIMYVLLALVFSFLCSVAEAVLLSVTPSYIEQLRAQRPKTAALLSQLKVVDVDRSLAAILTLNTIAHTVGAIGSGAKASVVFGSQWFGVFSAVMTLLILFLSEIIPKTLGAVHWRALAAPTALFVRGLTVVLYPVIWVSERLTRLIARGHGMHVFSRDEFVAMAGVGERAGHINERESRIIRNLFRLESLRTQDIMTPRTVVVALREELTVTEALQSVADTPFSRLPVYKTDLDDATGFVLKGDLLLAQARDRGATRLTELRRPIMTVPEPTPISGLLEELLDQRQHIAVVVGSYGGTTGIVTLEDVVETLLGMEIVDELDAVDDMQALARRQWEKRARALGLVVDDDATPLDPPPATGEDSGS